MEPTRRFDDREIALILERAGHLQESTQANPGNEGLTLAQLQEIARDVGIAPEHVAQAAHAVARGELAPSRSPFMWPIEPDRSSQTSVNPCSMSQACLATPCRLTAAPTPPPSRDNTPAATAAAP
jgi:hypothetical protein